MKKEIFFYKLGNVDKFLMTIPNTFFHSFSFDWQPQNSLVHPKMPKYVAEHPAKPDLLVVSENRSEVKGVNEEENYEYFQDVPGAQECSCRSIASASKSHRGTGRRRSEPTY